jgi:hypothetical protein
MVARAGFGDVQVEDTAERYVVAGRKDLGRHSYPGEASNRPNLGDMRLARRLGLAMGYTVEDLLRSILGRAS